MFQGEKVLIAMSLVLLKLSSSERKMIIIMIHLKELMQMDSHNLF